MKYINCEFGFEGRPPNVQNFMQVSENGPEIKNEYFPNRYIAAPGLDYSAWNGAMLIGPKGSLWGVRVNYYDNGKLVSGNDFYERVPRSGPYAADGSYARITCGPITISWARIKENMIYGHVTCVNETRIEVECYAPYNWPSSIWNEDGWAAGKSPYVAAIAGDVHITGGHAQYRNRYRVVMEDSGAESFTCIPFTKPQAVKSENNKVKFEYVIAGGESVSFITCVNAPAGQIPDKDQSYAAFRKSEEKYMSDKLTGTGILGRCAEPCVNEMMWMNTYFPFNMTPFFPAGRPWMGDGNFNIWGWDEAINGCIASYFSDFNAICNQAKMTIGDERMGPLMLWCAYSHYSQIEGLEECYQEYRKIYPPGNPDLVRGGWGNGNVGKGMDDTPMREVWRGLGEMYSLDMSCMKAWSIEVLTLTARKLGMEKDAEQYAETHRQIIDKINEKLWNDQEGIYMNRYVSGEWPTVISPTSFYPLLAGAPDRERAKRLLNALTDKSKFWGEYVIPTLSKDDVEYGKPSRSLHEGRTFPPYCYWRGTIWPPSNYIVYLGLVRYRFDELAAEFASKTVGMWWNTWEKTGWSCENYFPDTGERSDMSHKHQSWAQLFPLMGIQELIDVEIWGEGMRFGTFQPGSHSLSNFRVRGDIYSINVDDDRTDLYKNGECVFEGKGGKFIVHDYICSGDKCEFTMEAKSDVTVKLPDRDAFILPAGYHEIKL